MANKIYSSNGKFKYKYLEELENDIRELGLEIKVSKNLDVFQTKVQVGDHVIPNSLASHPMEGGDGDLDGTPTEFTFRKYERIARGGAGLIWIEAVSVCSDGRSNDKEIWITEDNWMVFKKLNDLIKSSAKDEFGDDYDPITVIQLNHSGRYCKVNGKPRPVLTTHKKALDDRLGITNEYPIVSDDYLDELQEHFLKASRLSKKAGFDGVDIKACHGYLLGEILSAHEREGKYGGCFENRTRLMAEIIDKIKQDEACKGLLLASRINIYDALPYPQGFGVSEGNGLDIDLEEPKKLIKLLNEKGVALLSLTMGNPYFIPHINKPYDMGTYTPDEDVIMSCNRLIQGVGEMQKSFPEIAFAGVGYSWFRHLSPYVAAGSLENGLCKIVGYGRESIAYPNFAKDLLFNKEFNSKEVCISCSKCSEMKSKIGTCGCVIRDTETYLPIYKDMKAKEEQ